jgi:uncharacterized membrane protein
MTPLRLFLLTFVLALLAAMAQLGALQIAFDKLGLAPEAVVWLFILTLLGSMVNLPLLTIKADSTAEATIFQHTPERRRHRLSAPPGKTVVAVNVGGCLIPVAFSLYLFLRTQINFEDAVSAVALVTLVVYYSSALVPGIGVVMPMLAAPLTAAFVGVNLDATHAAPLAYIGGTLGVLLGADILRLKEIGKFGEAVMSIGGAGSFDGIFLAGLLAVLIA